MLQESNLKTNVCDCDGEQEKISYLQNEELRQKIHQGHVEAEIQKKMLYWNAVAA